MLVVKNEGLTKYRSLQILGFMLTEQSQQINWKLLAGRVLITWIMCCISISTLLKAQLTSFITNPPIDPLDNFDELVSGGFRLNLISAKVSLFKFYSYYMTGYIIGTKHYFNLINARNEYLTAKVQP